MKKIISLFLALAILCAISACSGSETSSSSTNSSASSVSADSSSELSSDSNVEDKDVTVSWSTYTSTDTALANMDKYTSQPVYNETGIKVDFKVYPTRDSLIVEVAGGAGPDIMDLDGPTDVIEFINSGKAVDLTSYSQQYKWDELFMDWAYSACYYNEKLYSLPTCYEGMGMYYNTDVMEANGWEIPGDVTELETLCQKILDSGLVPISFGNSNYQGAVDWLYSTMLSCYGGVDNLTKVLHGEDTLQGNEDVKNSMQKLVDWWQKGYIDNNSQSITNDDMIARFVSGDAVMMISGTWTASSLVTDYPDCNWEFDLMPTATPGVDPIFPIAIGGCAVINGNSTQQDAAAEVMNYVYANNQENHYKSIVDTGSQPYPVNWFDTSKLDGMNDSMVHLYTVLNDAMKDNEVGYCSWTFYPADARTFMNENTDACFLGTMTVDEYLTGAQKFIDAAIEEGTSPQLPDLK